METNYPACLDFTLRFEGGYVNHPHDPGGCTNKGITIGTYNQWFGPGLTCGDLKEITDAEVAHIYREGYWKPVWGDDLPSGLELQVWDFGVNSGPSRAIKYLQRMVKSTQDGIMGPNTMQATHEYVNITGLPAAIKIYNGMRQNFYESLSTWPTFGKGWTRRNTECLALGLELAEADVPVTLPISKEVTREEFMALVKRVEELERWRKS